MGIKKIDEVYLYIVVDKDKEFILTAKGRDKTLYPFMAINKDVVDDIRGLADKICLENNQKYEIRHFVSDKEREKEREDWIL